MATTKVARRLKDGSPVFDATSELTIHVTRADIEKANRNVPDDCAVARCIRREHHAVEVHMHRSRVFVRRREKGPWTRYHTPRALSREIVIFDRGGEMMPGEYTLRKIEGSHKPDYMKRYNDRKRPGRHGHKRHLPPRPRAELEGVRVSGNQGFG